MEPRKFTNAVYVGKEVGLLGQTALLRDDPVTAEYSKSFPMVLAQFDNRDLEHKGVMLAFHWHLFERTDFQEDEENE